MNHTTLTSTHTVWHAFAGGWPALAVLLGLAAATVLVAIGDAGLFVAWAAAVERRRARRAASNSRKAARA